MIDIKPSHFALVKQILKQYIPQCEVRVFGSRYKLNAKPHSDLDLVLIGDAKLDKIIVSRLKEAFAESDLPFRVDVLDWNAISNEFRQIIEQGYEIIQQKSLFVK